MGIIGKYYRSISLAQGKGILATESQVVPLSFQGDLAMLV